MIGYETLNYSHGYLILGILSTAGITCLIATILYFFIDGWFNSTLVDNYNNNNNNLITRVQKGAKSVIYNQYNQKSYANVWVKRFIRDAKGGWVEVIKFEHMFGDDETNFSWKWIDTDKRYGWVQDKPPAEPCTIISAGAEDEVTRILKEYNSNKTQIKDTE